MSFCSNAEKADACELREVGIARMIFILPIGRPISDCEYRNPDRKDFR